MLVSFSKALFVPGCAWIGPVVGWVMTPELCEPTLPVFKSKIPMTTTNSFLPLKKPA
jgi:hypothetical protein